MVRRFLTMDTPPKVPEYCSVVLQHSGSRHNSTCRQLHTSLWINASTYQTTTQTTSDRLIALLQMGAKRPKSSCVVLSVTLLVCNAATLCVRKYSSSIVTLRTYQSMHKCQQVPKCAGTILYIVQSSKSENTTMLTRAPPRPAPSRCYKN